MIRTLAVANYRSLRDLVVGLGRLTVVTGANGTGKSSLYRALHLLADSARNGAVAALAREGGLPSTLWAGPETISRAMRAGEAPVQGTVRRGPVALRLGYAGDDFGYAVDFGLPTPDRDSLFGLDPLVKREAVWAGPVLRPATALAQRSGTLLRLRDGGGRGTWANLPEALGPFDSMLSEYSDPHRAPELTAVRDAIRSWRFYDHLRTDATAPARQAWVGTRTPVLAADGADLAAALQTIVEIGDAPALAAAVDGAFPGSTVQIKLIGDRLELRLQQPGLLRALRAAELSDGTLRYLLWCAALLTPRPPTLMVINEPETSLHPDLLPSLAGLIAGTATRTQVVVVTHSSALQRSLVEAGTASGVARDDLARDDQTSDDLVRIDLVKDTGETTVAGQGRFERPPWQWPDR